MKRISYNLFPIPVLILGYIFILFSIAFAFLDPESGRLTFHAENLPASATLLIIGLIVVTFRSSIIIPREPGFLLRESAFLGISFSQERIRIPGRCSRILICGKIKKGTGYYRFILPVTYFFKSFDMVFCGELGMAKIMNTDLSRALKVAEFLKENLKIDYRFEPEIN